MSNKAKNKRQSLAEPSSATKKRIRSSISNKESPSVETEVKSKKNELFEKDSEKNDSSTETDVKIELPNFTSNDLNKLLENIKKSLPENDQLKYNTRLEKLDWENIKLENFSIEECKKILSHAFSFIRKFKTLNEVLTDAIVSASKPNSRIYKSNKNNLKPKHPSSSYMIFANEIRDKLRKQCPNASIIEIGKMIGEKWRSLSNIKKEKYVKKFEENKKIYLEEVSKYNLTNNNQEKKKKDSDKPKTPLMIYLSEKIEKNNPDLEGFNFKEKQNYYRNKYNSLSDKKKFKYITKCLEAEEIYKEKLKDKFKTQNVEFKSVLNKNERELVEKMNGKPSNPPSNGYALFVKENIIKPEFSLIEPKQRNQSLAIKWKTLNKEEKEQYNIRAKDKKEKFFLEMSNYVQSLPQKDAVDLYMRNSAGVAKDIIMKRLDITS